VLATTYLMFNEGYAATAGPELTRPALVAEALRLTRLLHRLRPNDPGATGLLALILLQDSRRAARTDGAGAAVLLADQDRTQWDRAAITEAVPLVGEGLRLSPAHPDPYVVQAAIAACHALAPSWEETDWVAIESWYEVLLRVDDGPVVRLNHAVAVAEARGPQQGLDLVDAIDGLRDYPLWHATRAALLRRLDRPGEAAAADDKARRLPLNAVQRNLLDR
jgi:RNA polymerase sigma-70 factor, ECF subfamily